METKVIALFLALKRCNVNHIRSYIAVCHNVSYCNTDAVVEHYGWLASCNYLVHFYISIAIVNHLTILSGSAKADVAIAHILIKPFQGTINFQSSSLGTIK